MGKRRFLLTVGTKLPIATVGRQITPTPAEVVACPRQSRFGYWLTTARLFQGRAQPAIGGQAADER